MSSRLKPETKRRKRSDMAKPNQVGNPTIRSFFSKTTEQKESVFDFEKMTNLSAQR